MKRKEFDPDNNNNVDNNNPKSSKEDNLGMNRVLSESFAVRNTNTEYLKRGELVESIDYIARDVGRVGSNVLNVRSKMTKMMDKIEDIEGVVLGSAQHTKSNKVLNSYLPLVRMREFTGRDEVLALLNEVFKSGQTISISAFAGTGKSSLGLEYAYRQKGVGKGSEMDRLLYSRQDKE